MGLLEIVAIFFVWGLAAGGGWLLWRSMPVGPSGSRAPVRWGLVLGALGVAGVGALAALLGGGSLTPALAGALRDGGPTLVLASPLDGVALHAKGTMWLLHVWAAPPLATAGAWMWAPARVGRGVALGAALLMGVAVGGGLALPLVAGMLSAMPVVEGAPPVIWPGDLLDAFVMSSLVLGYGFAAACGVTVVGSTSRMAWRRCALASAGWGAVASVWAGVLTPPDVLTFSLAAAWMWCGWGLGLVAGGAVVWSRGGTDAGVSLR